LEAKAEHAGKPNARFLDNEAGSLMMMSDEY
jgi:hypothetical protein